MVGRGCVLWGNITVGNNVSIVAESYIFTSSHYVQDPNFRAYHAPVVICDRAWLGARSIVQPGVKIGEGAVLGSGSIATRDLEDFGIYLGAPARQVKKRNTALTYELNFKTYFS